MASVLMRQTNIIWVTMTYGKYMVAHAIKNLLNKKHKKKTDLQVTQKVIFIVVYCFVY